MRPRPATASPPPAPPRLPGRLEQTSIDALDCREACSELALSDAEFVDQRARGLRLDAVRLCRVDAAGSDVHGVRIVDGDLTDSNLANLRARGAEASRLAIARSRLTGIDLHEASLTDLTITGCRVDLASFGSARLVRVTFDDCVLTEATFIDAELDAVRFNGCDLTRADFRGARLRRCEFRHSDLTQLEGITHLRGSAIDLPTVVGLATVWAAALGVGILDDPASD